MVYYYKAFGLLFSSEIYLPECITSDVPEVVDFAIVISNFELPELEPTNIHRRGVYAQSARGTAIDNELYIHWDGIASYRALSGNRLEVCPLTKEGDVLSLFTVSEALGMILFQRGYYLLHASAVQVGSHAFVFMGSPGAGKSTTAAAFIKAGCPLLGDDLTAITFDEQHIPYVIPAYPQLKIWKKSVNGLGWEIDSLERVSEGVNKFAVVPTNNFSTQAIPLSHFVFLEVGDQSEFEVSELSPLQVPSETLKHFPLEDQWLEPDILTRLFHQSIDCAKHAVMWQAKRPDNFMALEKWVHQQISSDVDRS